MRRMFAVWVGLLLCLFVLNGCHEFSEDTTSATPVNKSEVTAKQGETANLDGLQITVLKSEFFNPQLSLVIRIENKTEKPINLKSNKFVAMDSADTQGIEVSCGGKGLVATGELKTGEKIDADLCWFVVGAVPPITITYDGSLDGLGKAIIKLDVQ